MTHGSLFSGIGGFDLAAEWMGWQNIFHCEWNAFGQRVLKHYWPDAKSYADITQTDFTIHRGTIDILTGGFPCQPYSMAGKRLGTEDDRHLWPEMLRAIREIQPRWVVGENVGGLVNWNGGMVFDEVQADLEAQGYEVQPFILPACAVNAPHRRDRVWFVANACSFGGLQQRAGRTVQNGNRFSPDEEPGREFQPVGFDGGSKVPASNPNGSTARPPGKGGNTEGNRGENNAKPERRGGTPEQHTGCNDVLRNDANTGNTRLQRSAEFGSIGSGGQNGAKQSARLFRSDWQKFPTQPPVCSGNDGLPAGLDGIAFSKWRNESIKAGGNAIVPQVAYQIFKAIQQLEQSRIK